MKTVCQMAVFCWMKLVKLHKTIRCHVDVNKIRMYYIKYNKLK